MIELPLLETIYKNKLLVDLLNNKNKLKDFHLGTDLNSIDEAFLANRDIDLEKRALLVECLKKQYSDCEIPAPLTLDSLSNKGVFTVTTGHQLCLFGGPQYFIHKIISVISLVKKLKLKYPENDFVPVFWLASEDHDFKEISTLNIFNKKLSVDGEDTIAVGKLSPVIFEPILEELKNIFKNDNRFNELESVFSKALTKQSWSLATRYWVTHLFGKDDLVILDPDEKSLKHLFIDSFKKEINHQFIHANVEATNSELKTIGYHPKINPRELNLFYLSDEKRHRIIFNGTLFKVGDEEFTKKQLNEKLELNPEKFSPNVLLRPLFQETILPNLIYVGGPSELCYWTQLKKAFDYKTIPFPILMLRDHFAWLNQKQIKKWFEMGLHAEDLIKNPSDLAKQFLIKQHKNNLSLFNEEEALNLIELELNKKANLIDQSLVPMVNGSVKGMRNSLAKIHQKFLQSLKRTEDQKLGQIKKINNSIVSNGILVERTENFLGPYLNSTDDYINRLIEASNCEAKMLQVLIY